MTKEEYLKDVIPHEEWLKRHNEYVAKALEETSDYFRVDDFIKDHLPLASEEIIKNILADSWENYNCELGELENNLARIFSLPYETIVEYRTEKFWKEVA